jgi:indolepyruvate ferredoxin oxidoreductase beta subunit
MSNKPARKREKPAKDTVTPATTNVLMAGVGGQGVLVASETLALAGLAEGLEAKQSEVHGVAQRGGSVVSHVRLGPRVHSPLIRCGDGDVLYGAERLETLRFAHYVKAGGLVVMDDRVVRPIQLPDEPEQPYPEGVAEFLRGKGLEVLVVQGLEAAVELGDKRCANVVLLGALSTRLTLADESWQAAIRRRFPERILDLNLRAFEEGRRLAAVACG